MREYITIQGETIDLICRRVYGDESKFVEEVLKINPGVAALGPKLPIGVRIKLPDLAKLTEPTSQSYWD